MSTTNSTLGHEEALDKEIDDALDRAVQAPVDAMTDAEIEDLGRVLTAYREEEPLATPPWPEHSALIHARDRTWPEYSALIHARDRSLGLRPPQQQAVAVSHDNAAIMPSGLDQVARAAFRPMRESVDSRATALQSSAQIHDDVERVGLAVTMRHRVTVDLHSSPSLALQASLPLYSPDERVEGDVTDLAALCVERIARMNTETFKDLLVLLDVCSERPSSQTIAINCPAAAVPAGARAVSWIELARRKGWSSLDKHNRRAKIRQSIKDLVSINFTFDLHDKANTRFKNTPLFHQSEVEFDEGRGRGEGVILTVNAVLWESMMKQRRAVIYDRAVLKGRLSGRGEWVFRFYRYLMTQISRGWQTQQIAAAGGRFTVQLGTLLDGTGVLYQHYLQRTASGTRPMGPKALRGQVRKVLKDMKAATWDRRPLFASATLKTNRRGRVLNDVITVELPAPIAEELKRLRSKSQNRQLAFKAGAQTKKRRLSRGRRTTPPDKQTTPP